MIHLSEWMPNPAGKDSAEWVELFNDGKTAVNISGWSLRTSKGKPVALRGVVPPGGYIVLKKSDFKFSLRNSEETISLFDPAGKLADRSSFHGLAENGKSVNHAGQNSFFGMPTPGEPNAATGLALINEPHPYGVALNSGASGWLPFGEALSAGLVIAILAVFIIQQFNGLSELFFGSY